MTGAAVKTIEYPNGDVFRGTHKSGNKYEGTCTLANGDTITGKWLSNGHCHEPLGAGVFTKAGNNGYVAEFEFSSDDHNNVVTLLRSETGVTDLRKGTVTYDHTFVWRGWVDRSFLPYGKGTLTCPAGSVFTGDIVSALEAGRGVLVVPHGDVPWKSVAGEAGNPGTGRYEGGFLFVPGDTRRTGRNGKGCDMTVSSNGGLTIRRGTFKDNLQCEEGSLECFTFVGSGESPASQEGWVRTMAYIGSFEGSEFSKGILRKYDTDAPSIEPGGERRLAYEYAGEFKCMSELGVVLSPLHRTSFCGRGVYHEYRKDGGMEVKEGEWADDQLNGAGVVRRVNAQKQLELEYRGFLKEDKFHGDGYLKKMDGHTGSHYVGGFFEGLRHGRGFMRWTLGAQAGVGVRSSYVGEFHNDKIHGQGKLRYSNGDEYTGSFVDDLRQGTGTLHSPKENTKYEGEWLGDQREDSGAKVTYLDSGDTLLIGFQNDRKHGRGQHTCAATGATFVRYFENGFERRTSKKRVISELQDALDGASERIQDGDYARLCKMIKRVYESAADEDAEFLSEGEDDAPGTEVTDDSDDSSPLEEDEDAERTPVAEGLQEASGAQPPGPAVPEVPRRWTPFPEWHGSTVAEEVALGGTTLASDTIADAVRAAMNLSASVRDQERTLALAAFHFALNRDLSSATLPGAIQKSNETSPPPGA